MFFGRLSIMVRQHFWVIEDVSTTKMTLLPARWHYGYNEDSQEKEDNPSLSPSHFPERGTIRKLPGFGSAA